MERLIEAMSIARARHGIDAQLTVLGGTAEERAALLDVVAHHAAQSFVHVKVRVPRQQVYEVRAQHHAGAIFIARDPRFVVASTTKLVESLAIGLPCVCTDAVAMHEQLAQRTGAIAMSDDTAAGFAAGIAQLEANWEHFAARANAARQPMHDEYSYENARARMEQLVIDLVGEHR